MRKPTLKQKKRVDDLLEQFDWFFGVQNYDRAIIYKEEADGEACCAIERSEDYHRLTLKIYPIFWEEKIEDQRQYLLHEFCHCITGPLIDLLDEQRNGKLVSQEQTRHANERATSSMEHMVDALLRGKKTFMKKAYSDYLKS